MIKKSLSNIKYFEISDEKTNNTSYGCNQEWYKTIWQRRAGCGPTVASNTILYLSHSGQGIKLKGNLSNTGDCLELMEQLWKHVTPTLKGVNTTQLFYDGMMSYAKSAGLNMEREFIDIPAKKPLRPNLTEVIKFIEFSLDNDVPVSFLNLCNGEEKYLDRWHWVTVISLEYAEDGSSAAVEILDEGMVKKINLLLWYNTTTLGGGFVSFNVKPELNNLTII